MDNRATVIHWLDSVRFKDLSPQILLAVIVADQVWGTIGDVWVTSCNDGTHSGKPVVGGYLDPHYEGLAVDLRTKDLFLYETGDRENRVKGLAHRLSVRLGPQFVVLLEDLSGPNEHIHVQYGHVAPA